jgi:hypothetical protein
MKPGPKPKAKTRPDAFGDDDQVLEDLGREFPEETQTIKDMRLSPEEIEPLLALGFFAGSNTMLNWLKRQNVSAAEAERWAKATNIVYGRFINKLPIGMVIHGVITLGILTSKQRVNSSATPKTVEVKRAA